MRARGTSKCEERDMSMKTLGTISVVCGIGTFIGTAITVHHVNVTTSVQWSMIILSALLISAGVGIFIQRTQ